VLPTGTVGTIHTCLLSAGILADGQGGGFVRHFFRARIKNTSLPLRNSTVEFPMEVWAGTNWNPNLRACAFQSVFDVLGVALVVFGEDAFIVCPPIGIGEVSTA
jgi:hypothetical protein